MRGVPLRSPYHLYQKKNKSVSCFLAYKLIISLTAAERNAEKIMGMLQEMKENY